MRPVVVVWGADPVDSEDEGDVVSLVEREDVADHLKIMGLAKRSGVTIGWI